MLKLFEKNTLIQLTVILTAVGLLWIPSIANPTPMAPAEGFAPLYSLVYSIGLSPTASVVIAMVVTVLGGFWLNLVLANSALVSQNSLLPTLLYILFMSAGVATLSPSLIVSVLTIALISLLMLHSTHLTVASDKIFGTAAIIGLCSLFYLPSLALILSYILVAISYRLYSWRDWMVFLLGLLAPYMPVWAVLFFTDGLSESFAALSASLTFHLSPLTIHLSPSHAANATLLILFVVSLLALWSRLGESTVVWKKNAITVMLITVPAIAMLPYAGFLPVNLQFIAIPGALCISQWLTAGSRRRSGSRRKWRTYIYDLLLIATIIAALLC